MARSGVHKLLKGEKTFPLYSHSYPYNSYCTHPHDSDRTNTYGCLCTNPYEGIYIMQRGAVAIFCRSKKGRLRAWSLSDAPPFSPKINLQLHTHPHGGQRPTADGVAVLQNGGLGRKRVYLCRYMQYSLKSTHVHSYADTCNKGSSQLKIRRWLLPPFLGGPNLNPLSLNLGDFAPHFWGVLFCTPFFNFGRWG